MTAEQIDVMNAFASGMIAMGHATAGFFFWRFWSRTADRLFLMFALAFWLLGILRVLMMLFAEPGEEHFLYWFRLIGYLLILMAIVQKNWKK
jgi:hypothetical protein